MRAIIEMEIRKNIQDKGLLFWMILLPMIFTVLFISMFTSGANDIMREEIIISIVPGYVVMFVFFIMISMVSAFIKDRDNGMVARLASTPLTPLLYLLGKWIPYMFIVLIQIIILFGFGKMVYQIPIGQPILVSILSLILTITVTSLGLALALFAKTENMGIAITQLIALGGAMLGGLWMPVETMPQTMQTIAKLTPQYWAHQAFQDAMVQSLSSTNFFITILILCCFGIVGFVLAYIQYPNYLKQARN